MTMTVKSYMVILLGRESFLTSESMQLEEVNQLSYIMWSLFISPFECIKFKDDCDISSS